MLQRALLTYRVATATLALQTTVENKRVLVERGVLVPLLGAMDRASATVKFTALIVLKNLVMKTSA